MENEYKIILLGDRKSGIRSLLQLSNDSNETINSKFGIQFKFHKVNLMGQQILNIYKLKKVGGNRLAMIHFMKIINLVIIVYDVTNPYGLESVQRWLQFIEENSQFQNIMIVANKIDIIEERVITQNQGLELAQQHGLPYFETSLNKQSIDIMFKSALQIMIHGRNKQQILQNPYLIEENIELGNRIRKYKQNIVINMIFLSSLLSLVTLILTQTSFTQIIGWLDLEKHYIIRAVGGVIVTLFSLFFVINTVLTYIRQ